MAPNEDQIFARRSHGSVTLRRGAGPVIAAALLVMWEIVARALRITPSLLPSPSRVLLEVWRKAPQLVHHASVTGTAALEGLLLATLAALLVTVLSCWSADMGRITAAAVSLLRKVPLITLAPLAIVWFGFGTAPAVALSFAICFVMIVATLQAGLASLPAGVFETLHTMGATPGQIFWKAQVPACLPFLTRGLKIAMHLALGSTAVVEFFGADEGLGFQMLYASSRADAVQLFAALTVLFLMALGGYLVVFFAERLWIPWALHGGGLPPHQELPDPDGIPR